MSAFCLACALLSFYTRARAQAPATSTAPAAASGTVAWAMANLRHPDQAKRGEASAILLKAGPAALPEILPQISVQRTRVQLLKIISAMGPKASLALVDLTADPALGAASADALSFVGRRDDPAQIPGLIRCLKTRADIRETCGQALARASGPKAAGSLAALLPLISDRDTVVRTYGLLAVAQVGAGAGAAVKPALKALDDSSAQVRVVAARALGAIGRATPEVRAALKKAAADPMPEVALAAGEALKRLPKRSAAPAGGGKAPK